MRIALIHALQHSIAPINTAFARDWPDALRMNLLDDSLSADLAHDGGVLSEAMHQRFEALADYAFARDADAILFTCSAFGSCIERVALKHAHSPVLKPNEAMIAEIAALGKPTGLIASFAPTLISMPPEFPQQVDLRTALVADAMRALDAGDTVAHDALVVAAAQNLAEQGAQTIALAQFSMSRAKNAVERATSLPVFTTPDSAIRLLRECLAR